MKKWLLILSVFTCFLSTFGQNKKSLDEIIKNPPVPIKYVHDYTGTGQKEGVLTAFQSNYLEEKLRKYDDSTSVQIAVLLVNTLEGKSIEDVGIELGRSWGVGGKGTNNGIVIIAAITDRKIRIETGRSIEAQVPDYTCSEIIDNDIKPNFRNSLYYEGLDAATNDIIKSVAGTYKAPSNYHKSKKSGGGFYTIMMLLFVGFIVLSAITRKGGGGGGMMSRRGYSGWTPPIWTGGGSSSSGSSSSSGGGWSGGFGGGDFGGGGASGDW